MKLLTKLVSFYVNASIHVALAVYSLIRITELYYGLAHNGNLNFTIFFGTIFCYNYIKYADIIVARKTIPKLNIRYILIVSIVSLVVAIYYLLQLERSVLFIISFFTILTLLYINPLNNYYSLRKLKAVKIFLIAIVWTEVSVFLPLYAAESEVVLEFKQVLHLFQRLLFIIALTIPFDIRDYTMDDKSLATLVQLFGVESVKKIALILLLLVLILEFSIAPNSGYRILFLVLVLVLHLFIQRATTDQSDYYSSFWIEGLPIFWWLGLLLIMY